MIGMLVAGAAQPPADRQAVLAGQHQVEHHQVEALAREQLVHRVRVRHGAHDESLLGEVAVEQVAQPHVVVDDEDLGFRFSHGRYGSGRAARE